MTSPRVVGLAPLLACAVMAVGACAKGGAEEASLPDSSAFEPPGFEVELPGGWERPSPAHEARVERQVGDQVEEVAGDDVAVDYSFVGFVPGREGIYLEVSSEPAIDGMTTERFTVSSRESLDVLGPVVDLTETSEEQVGSSDALAYEYDQTLYGVDNTFRTINLVYGGAGFNINFSSDPGMMDEHEGEIQAILDSWRWTD